MRDALGCVFIPRPTAAQTDSLMHEPDDGVEPPRTPTIADPSGTRCENCAGRNETPWVHPEMDGQPSEESYVDPFGDGDSHPAASENFWFISPSCHPPSGAMTPRSVPEGDIADSAQSLTLDWTGPNTTWNAGHF